MDNLYNGSEVRQYILDNGILLWKVADKLGISDGNFSRKLRHNFSEEDYNKIVSAVDELSKKA